jgi:hypothetical protein
MKAVPADAKKAIGAVQVQLYSYLNSGTDGGEWNFTPWPLYPEGGTPIHVVQEAGLAPAPVWPICRSEKSPAPVEIRNPHRPAGKTNHISIRNT